MSKKYTNAEADDFLSKVTDVHDHVRGIIDGSISIEQIDEKLELDQKIVSMKEREKTEAAEKKLLVGRSGKGHRGTYTRFCNFCFTEFDIDIDKCTHCNHDTITQDERMGYLNSKLEEMKLRTKTKKERKAKWENWVKTQAMFL
jgi:hypothetical protein